VEVKKIERVGHSATLTKDELWDIYKSMKTQRILEDRLLKMYKGGQLSGAVYPGIGQELEEHIEILVCRLNGE
jgi:TPP-dependent pyruvate/acetoin dehydrogenase alpha subunit